jgi:hypothetical protein
MAQNSEAKGEFRVVLNGVRSDAVPAVARELTKLFPLDLPNATNIAKNAPIILLDKLTSAQARSVGTYAVRLKALGAEVQITSQPVGKLQVLRWPLLPDVAKRPGNQIICPNCGVRLQMKVVPAESGPVPTPAQAPKEDAAAEVRPAAAQEAAAEPEPELPEVMASPEAPAEEKAPPPQETAPPPAAEPEPEEPEDDEVILEPVDEEEEPAAEEAPVEVSGEEVILEEPEEEEEEQPPAEPGAPVGGEGNCRVTLVGKIRGKKKRKAAELMAYYQGISEDEALSQLGRTVVTVAKELTEEQAEACKEQFSEIGVKVNVKG